LRFGIKQFIALLLIIAPLLVMADSGTVMLKDSAPLEARTISADQYGNLYCFDGTREIIVPVMLYSYVRMPKPETVKQSETKLELGKYAEAEKMFRNAALKYEYLGWKAFCVFGLANSLLKQGRHDAAVAEIEKIVNDEIDDPDYIQWQYMEAFRLLVTVYLQKNQNEKAVIILEKMVGARRGEYIVFAYNTLGDISLKQGDANAAAQQYLRAVISADKSVPARAESIYKLAELLKRDKKSAYKNYYEMLKKEYPKSDLINKISE
jgi:tetratricopeptide (TPR) repeat protein